MVPMMGNKVAINPATFEQQENVAIAYGMGMTGEKVAEQWHISREAQDEFAFTSHKRALRAIETNEFNQEITPYPVVEKTGFRKR